MTGLTSDVCLVVNTPVAASLGGRSEEEDLLEMQHSEEVIWMEKIRRKLLPEIDWL